MVVAIENNKYYIDTSSNHNLIVGSTGSGKTVSVILPLIFNLADSNESMIINDVKGELYKYTYNYLKKKKIMMLRLLI
ncbi:MAG: type IV secretory system conjugative DNA transfer family protein [Bacilli bacterium]|nr:MAG: type IV secretory system conjugative DNA transfer family protein [Bacilli bacterium]